jgi:hypothetical protein
VLTWHSVGFLLLLEFVLCPFYEFPSDRGHRIDLLSSILRSLEVPNTETKRPTIARIAGSPFRENLVHIQGTVGSHSGNVASNVPHSGIIWFTFRERCIQCSTFREHLVHIQGTVHPMFHIQGTFGSHSGNISTTATAAIRTPILVPVSGFRV